MPGRHSPDTRPVADQDDQLRVVIYAELYALVDVSETDQTMSTIMMITHFSNNIRMRWNSSEYNLKTTVIPNNRVYIPKMKVRNDRSREHKQLCSEASTTESYACGSSRGTCTEYLTSACDIDITYYPFDSQRCDIDIMAAERIYYVKLFSGDRLRMDTYTEDGSWDIVDTEVYYDTSLEFSTLRYSFILKRKTTYYMLTMLLPLLFLSCTTTVVFAIPTDSGEKMGTSITVLLAYSFYLSSVTEYLPDTSLHISILGLYLTTLFGICTLSVVATATVLHVHFKSTREPIGERLDRFTRWVHGECRKPEPHVGDVVKASVYSVGQELENNFVQIERSTPGSEGNLMREEPSNSERGQDSQANQDDVISWPDVAKAMDRVCLVVFTSLNILSTILFIAGIAIGSAVNQKVLEPNEATNENDITPYIDTIFC